jgi:hypothetical protein
MLNYERWEDPQNAMNAALDNLQSRMWTKLPCIVTAIEDDGQHVTVQSTITPLLRQVDASGNVSWVPFPMPLMPMVPIKFPSGGGYTMTFPVAVGDEGTISFSSRCIDNWWLLGGVQPTLASNNSGSLRKHDLSDGFFELGGRNSTRLLNNVSDTTVQLRSDDGTASVTFSKSGLVATLPDSAATMSLTPAGFSLAFPGGFFSVDSNGNVTASGDVTAGSGTGGSVTLQNHDHNGVKPGTGTTAPPVPGS